MPCQVHGQHVLQLDVYNTQAQLLSNQSINLLKQKGLPLTLQCSESTHNKIVVNYSKVQ